MGTSTDVSTGLIVRVTGGFVVEVDSRFSSRSVSGESVPCVRDDSREIGGESSYRYRLMPRGASRKPAVTLLYRSHTSRQLYEL
jgi:hypothetical protein